MVYFIFVLFKGHQDFAAGYREIAESRVMGMNIDISNEYIIS